MTEIAATWDVGATEQGMHNVLKDFLAKSHVAMLPRGDGAYSLRTGVRAAGRFMPSALQPRSGTATVTRLAPDAVRVTIEIASPERARAHTERIVDRLHADLDATFAWVDPAHQSVPVIPPVPFVDAMVLPAVPVPCS